MAAFCNLRDTPEPANTCSAAIFCTNATCRPALGCIVVGRGTKGLSFGNFSTPGPLPAALGGLCRQETLFLCTAVADPAGICGGFEGWSAELLTKRSTHP